MSTRKEYELWDTCSQTMLNDYKTQSAALTAMYDYARFGMRNECLDLFLQRPNDKQIYVCSPRDANIQEWFEAMDKTIMKLRLTANTDIIGVFEWMEYGDVQWVTEDRGGTQTKLNMERYAAVVSDSDGIAEGIGATEFEALAQALIRLKENK